MDQPRASGVLRRRPIDLNQRRRVAGATLSHRVCPLEIMQRMLLEPGAEVSRTKVLGRIAMNTYEILLVLLILVLFVVFARVAFKRF